MAAAVVLALLGGAAAFLQPWGRTLTIEDVQASAAGGKVSWVRVAEVGFEGGLATLGPIPPMPFRVPVAAEGIAGAVGQLRQAGVDVDTSLEVDRLVGMAASAQSRTRYFGAPGDDVLSYAQRAAALEPESDRAASLIRKVAERMAWDAQAASADGAQERAQELVDRCLALVPDHPRCLAARGDR
jgi:hypothetical protein